MEMSRKSFSFFHSYYEAAQDLSKKERAEFYEAIIEYSFTGKEPELKGVVSTCWKLVKPTLEKSMRDFLNGTKGGRPRKNKNPAFSEKENPGFETTKSQSITGEGVGEGEGIGIGVGVGVGVETAAPAVDLELSKIVQHYQQAVGDFPRSALDKLQKWRQEYSTEMILLAIDKAAEAGKRSWNYINGILSGWKRDGVKCLGDVKALDDLRAKQKANAPRNKAFMASRPPEEAAKSPDFLKNAANRRPLTRKKEEKSA